jgi:hypothetical protein
MKTMITNSHPNECSTHKENLPTWPEEKLHNKPTKKGIDVHKVYKIKKRIAEVRSPVFPTAMYIAIGKTITSKMTKNDNTSPSKKHTLELSKTTKKRKLFPHIQILAITTVLNKKNKKFDESTLRNTLFHGKKKKITGLANKPNPPLPNTVLNQTTTYHAQPQNPLWTNPLPNSLHRDFFQEKEKNTITFNTNPKNTQLKSITCGKGTGTPTSGWQPDIII